MKKVLIAILFGLFLTVARADDDEDRGRGRDRDCDNTSSPIPEASTYAAIGFVTAAVAFTVYKNKNKR